MKLRRVLLELATLVLLSCFTGWIISRNRGSSKNGPHIILHNPSKRIYPSQVSETLKNSLRSRYFRINGFEYCAVLNNASFDSSTFIYAIGGSVNEVNPKKRFLIELIEQMAKSVVEKVKKEQPFIEELVSLIFCDNHIQFILIGLASICLLFCCRRGFKFRKIV